MFFLKKKIYIIIGSLGFKSLKSNGKIKKFQKFYFFNKLQNQYKQKILEVSKIQKIKLKLIGVGYKINIFNEKFHKFLYLRLGYSHIICFKLPKKIKIKIIKQKIIIIYGYCKKSIHFFASILRMFKIPDIYKGKGILYENENIILKKNKKI